MKQKSASEDAHKAELIKLFAIGADRIDIIDSYCSIVGKWSKRVNIVSTYDSENLWARHVIPSAFLSANIDRNKVKKIADIGSGAGFPGIIIKILVPQISISLIDSSRKKYLFLLETCELLGIECDVLHMRAEVLASSRPRQFDCVVSRGVAPLVSLWTWAEKLITEQGSLLVLKGGDLAEEIRPLQNMNLNVKIIKADKSWLRFSAVLNDKYIIRIGSPHGQG